MATLQEKRQIKNNQSLISTDNLALQASGYNGHILLENGDSDTENTFSKFQVIGNPTTPHTVTVTYTVVTSKAGKQLHTTEVLYVGDIVQGIIEDISISAGSGRIRAYLA